MENIMSNFDTDKNLVVNTSEIIGLDEFVGTFSFKRLNIKERITANVNKNELTKGKEVETIFDNLAYVLSVLELATVKKPTGVILEELEVESLFELYEKYNTWVESFREKFRVSKEKAGKAGSK
jgi:hypothetical protein